MISAFIRFVPKTVQNCTVGNLRGRIADTDGPSEILPVPTFRPVPSFIATPAALLAARSAPAKSGKSVLLLKLIFPSIRPHFAAIHSNRSLSRSVPNHKDIHIWDNDGRHPGCRKSDRGRSTPKHTVQAR